MKIKRASKAYIVKPGDKIDLEKGNAGDLSLWEVGDEKGDAEVVLEGMRQKLRELQKVLYAENKHKILVVMQAMDAGGKDGCVKSVLATVDPQGIEVTAFKKPNEEELSHDFLWRIHQKAPRKGMMAVFNRSHYEDIIAVRVKKIFPEKVWRKRYKHVVDFEQMLVDEGTTVVKLFLNISKEEQGARLQARLDNPSKHWKFHPDDLKDRACWGEFMKAYGDLIEKTSTEDSPWYVIPANRKWYRNLVVAQILIDTLEGLKMKYPKIEWDPAEMKVD